MQKNVCLVITRLVNSRYTPYLNLLIQIPVCLFIVQYKHLNHCKSYPNYSQNADSPHMLIGRSIHYMFANFHTKCIFHITTPICAKEGLCFYSQKQHKKIYGIVFISVYNDG